jgi:hypothetical protein
VLASDRSTPGPSNAGEDRRHEGEGNRTNKVRTKTVKPIYHKGIVTAMQIAMVSSRTDLSPCTKNHRSPLFVSNPDSRSFWMIPKLSYIVIINLIATLSFLYHKPEKHAVIRID